MVERLVVRILVAVALATALLAFSVVSVPVDADGEPHLPALAFEQPGLYRLEIALLVFYGNLLLITPSLSGLFRGRLPVEISTRGAKFAQETNKTAAQDEVAIKALDETVADLHRRLTEAQFEIKRLSENPSRDSGQPKIDSDK